MKPLSHIKLTGIFLIALLAISCNNTKEEKNKQKNEALPAPTNRVILSSEIDWQQLNPARGDQSPKAGTIWGDRNGTEPTGFLAEFKDGFSSPPHIHNVTYRAIVLSGLVHNDDPNAEKMWMPTGSFWTQPAGEPHITAAKGEKNIAYVEIDKSPYLVKPTEDSFDNGERSINIDKSNIVWLDASQTTMIEKNDIQNNAKLAFLWSKNEFRGNYIKLPAGFKGSIISNGTVFRAVVIQGITTYKMPNDREVKTLDPGSSFSSEGKSIHEISASSSEESLIYIRTNDNFKIIESTSTNSK